MEKKYTPSKKKLYIKYLIRTVILWVGEVLGFILIANLSVGLTINSWETAVVVVTIIGILNLIFWPILSRLFLPFLVYTVGVGSLFLNGLMIWFVSNFIPGISIEGWALILTPIGMALITTILATIITIDDDASYYRLVFQRNISRKNKHHSNKPGVIFLEIDGLSESVLKEAIGGGFMPTLGKWLENGSHQLTVWETDLSSQTGASQAGILHGNNKDIPAFRWVEKPHGNRIMVSTGLSDAPLIEERISDGNGLLSVHGASRSNLFSGDAQDTIFTYSNLKNLRKFYSGAWYYLYSSPSSFGRIIILFLADVLKDFGSQLKHYVKNINPRIYRGFTYPFIRAGANVFLREVTTYTLIGDIITADIDVAYVTYLGYDEIAHHSGVRDEDSFNALKGLDKQFERLETAAGYSHRPYQFVVQSDHGQTNGATFKQRYDITLEDLVRGLLPSELKIYSELSSNEDHFSQAITAPLDSGKMYFKNKKDKTVGKGRGIVSDTIKNIEKHNIVEKTRSRGILDYIQSHTVDKNPKIKSSSEAEVVVLASGNLGLIYFTLWENRLNYEGIKDIFPDLIPGLVNHKGIGFIMVHSEEFGPIVIGSGGIYYLKTDIIEGENPLINFGENAAQHLKRTDRFKYVPDILINSFYNPEKNEVAAFEELVGSHGGLGGDQSYPFVLYPSEWKLDQEKLIGAEKLHEVLKDRLNSGVYKH
jgi:putative membrane protein